MQDAWLGSDITHTRNRFAAALVYAKNPFGNAGKQFICIDIVLRCKFVGIGIRRSAEKHDFIVLLYTGDICYIQHA